MRFEIQQTGLHEYDVSLAYKTKTKIIRIFNWTCLALTGVIIGLFWRRDKKNPE